MKKETKSLAGGMFWFLVLTAADQLTKLAAASYLKGRESLKLVSGVFELYYLENRGAAFGILRGKQPLLALTALLVILCIAFAYRRIPPVKRYVPLRIICIAVAAGSLGNVIDRLTHNYVIDFLYFSLIDFPVFNLADCYVSIGIIFMVILLFTYYRDESFEFLNPFRKRDSGSQMKGNK